MKWNPKHALAILQYALGREQAAIGQYSVLAKVTPAGPIWDLFAFTGANDYLKST